MFARALMMFALMSVAAFGAASDGALDEQMIEYMDDDWFDEYVYVVVIDKKYLSKDDSDLLDQKPVKLPMWDPFWSAMR